MRATKKTAGEGGGDKWRSKSSRRGGGGGALELLGASDKKEELEEEEEETSGGGDKWKSVYILTCVYVCMIYACTYMYSCIHNEVVVYTHDDGTRVVHTGGDVIQTYLCVT